MSQNKYQITMRGLVFWIGLWTLSSLCSQPSEKHLVEAHLQIRGEVATLSPPPLWDGRELWLPVQHLETLGIVVELEGQRLRLPQLPPESPTATLLLTEKKRTENAPPELCVPVRDLVRRVGGYTRWDETSQTLTVLAHLRSATLDEQGTIAFETSFSVKWRAFLLNNPPRWVIDLQGCALPDQPPTVKGAYAKVSSTRVAQFDPNTVRIVLELNEPTELKAEGLDSRWQIALERPTQLAEQPPTTPESPTPAPIAPTFQIPNIERTQEEVRLQLPVPPNTRPRMLFLEDPLRVVVEVPGTLQETLEQVVNDEGLFIRAIRAIPAENGLVRLVLELSRSVSVNLLPGAENLTINLRLPRNAGGSLKQKIIVIDPGHGGNQTGARWVGSKTVIPEKDITLAIGLIVAEELAREGASVILTRAEDNAIGLYERTAMANQASAHFFISIHCDSNPRPNSVSGTTIYYHKDNADSRALGQALLNEIVKVSGLPSLGVRSDSTLYQSGLAVLRTSQMPAVLIEVGYLNHATDRAKLVDRRFQERIAEAIVRGLKNYVEGN